MNRFGRFASWVVVLVGALVTMATSRAPGPTITERFERTLDAGDSTHVTVRASVETMELVRARTDGSFSVVLRTSAGGFTAVPDADGDPTVTIAPVAMSGGLSSAALPFVCPDAGACDVGFTLVGPETGDAAAVEILATAFAPGDGDFAEGAVVTIAED